MRHSTGLMFCILFAVIFGVGMIALDPESSNAAYVAPVILPTLTPTAIPTPTATPTPTAEPVRLTEGVPMYVRVSWYWPALGGPNCSRFVNGKCVSKTASGMTWEDGVDWACACPSEWPFGTTVTLEGKTWTCKDRGGAIKFKGGVPWVDLLQEYADYVYGEIVFAHVAVPEIAR